MGEEEVAGGGGAAPDAADGAAAEEGFGGQADEDLPDGDVIGEAREERRRCCCACGLRHGRRLGERFLAGAVEWVTAAERGGRPRNNIDAFGLGLAHLVEIEMGWACLYPLVLSFFLSDRVCLSISVKVEAP